MQNFKAYIIFHQLVIQAFIGMVNGVVDSRIFINCDNVGKGSEHPKFKVYHMICGRSNPFVIPREKDPIPVTIKIQVLQILEVDTRHGLLYCRLWFTLSWENMDTTWSPKTYPGVYVVNIPKNILWAPELTFENWLAGKGEKKDTLAAVQYNGVINWIRPMITVTRCELRIRLFPFDTQICQIVVALGVYDDNDVKLSLNSSISVPEVFVPNAEWNFYYYETGIEKYKQDGRHYSKLIFTLITKRNPVYYMYAVITPCVMLSLVTFLVFWIPCGSGEKISAGISTVLSYAVFMLLVAAQVPTHLDRIPLLGEYLIASMGMTCVSIIMSVVSSFMYNQSKFERRIPAIFRKTLHGIDDIVFGLVKDRNNIFTDFENEENTNNQAQDKSNNNEEEQSAAPKIKNMDEFKAKLAILKEQNADEWRICADILDRCLFYIYALSMTFMSVYLLLILPTFPRKDFGTYIKGKKAPSTVAYILEKGKYKYLPGRTGIFNGNEDFDIY